MSGSELTVTSLFLINGGGIMGSSLPKGLKKEVLVRGDPSRRVKRGDVVTVECLGSIQGGEQFWSTKDPGQIAFTFPCGMGKVSQFTAFLFRFL